MRMLIVEDDEVLLEGLRAGLAIEGFVTDAVETIEDARHAMDVVEYDAVVLDIALPDGSGLDLLHEWRRAGVVTPVLLLTARNAIRDRIEGLDGGADDYLGKPFDLDELGARIRAIGRRAKGVASTALVWRDIEIDVAHREVRRGGEPVTLSRRCCKSCSSSQAGCSRVRSSKTDSTDGRRRSGATRWKCIFTTCAGSSAATSSRPFAAKAIECPVNEIATVTHLSDGRGGHDARVVFRSSMDPAEHAVGGPAGA